MLQYRVIWIDDEWDKMPLFQEECRESHNIELIPFRNRKEGMEFFERQIESIDGVLLDAKMFDESDNEQANLNGLQKAVNRINQLDLKRSVPYFISTGQPDLIDNEMFRQIHPNYYIKERDDERLFEDMKKAMGESERKQIEMIYSDFFHSAESVKLDSESIRIIVAILRVMHFPANHTDFVPADYYPRLRTALEYVFRVMLRCGLIPEECLSNGDVNLMESSRYIAGIETKHSGVRYGHPGHSLISTYLSGIVLSVITYGNAHSHTPSEDVPSIQQEEKVSSAMSRSLIFSLTLGLCHLVTQIKDLYSESSSDIERNKSKRTLLINENAKENEVGYVFIPSKDENGMWATGECLLKQQEYNQVPHRIKSITENKNPKYRHIYPKFAYVVEIMTK